MRRWQTPVYYDQQGADPQARHHPGPGVGVVQEGRSFASKLRAEGSPPCAALLASSAVAALVLAGSGYAQTCTGKANPITDICWSCITDLDRRAHVATLGQEDIENPASPLCVCPGALRASGCRSASGSRRGRSM
jgi:hypothetical protein